MLFRAKKHRFESPEMLKLGRCEAAIETLELKWVGYRDEIKKLVSRLEKRDQRAEQKLRQAASQDDESGNNELNSCADVIDEVSNRVLARRKSRGIRE